MLSEFVFCCNYILPIIAQSQENKKCQSKGHGRRCLSASMATLLIHGWYKRCWVELVKSFSSSNLGRRKRIFKITLILFNKSVSGNQNIIKAHLKLTPMTSSVNHVWVQFRPCLSTLIEFNPNLTI